MNRFFVLVALLACSAHADPFRWDFTMRGFPNGENPTGAGHITFATDPFAGDAVGDEWARWSDLTVIDWAIEIPGVFSADITNAVFDLGHPASAATLTLERTPSTEVPIADWARTIPDGRVAFGSRPCTGCSIGVPSVQIIDPSGNRLHLDGSTYLPGTNVGGPRMFFPNRFDPAWRGYMIGVVPEPHTWAMALIVLAARGLHLKGFRPCLGHNQRSTRWRQ